VNALYAIHQIMDAGGGDLIRNQPGAAEVVLNRAAASILTFGDFDRFDGYE
jgi:hypothetical protein